MHLKTHDLPQVKLYHFIETEIKQLSCFLIIKKLLFLLNYSYFSLCNMEKSANALQSNICIVVLGHKFFLYMKI